MALLAHVAGAVLRILVDSRAAFLVLVRGNGTGNSPSVYF